MLDPEQDPEALLELLLEVEHRSIDQDLDAADDLLVVDLVSSAREFRDSFSHVKDWNSAASSGIQMQ